MTNAEARFNKSYFAVCLLILFCLCNEFEWEQKKKANTDTTSVFDSYLLLPRNRKGNTGSRARQMRPLWKIAIVLLEVAKSEWIIRWVRTNFLVSCRNYCLFLPVFSFIFWVAQSWRTCRKIRVGRSDIFEHARDKNMVVFAVEKAAALWSNGCAYLLGYYPRMSLEIPLRGTF